jgi:hypothetical protein
MDATEQAIDQTLKIAFEGTEYALKLTGAGAERLVALLWSVATTHQKTSGKARLKALLDSGKELKVFNVTRTELKDFVGEAKRYGVLYATVKGTKKNPDAIIDMLVKAEDAAKINRIVDKLGFGRFNETEVTVEAQHELDGADKTKVEKSEVRNDAHAILDKALSENPTQKGEPEKNPTEAKTDGSSPSKPSSKTDGRQQASLEKNAAKRTSKTRENTSFDAGCERPSVKLKIKDKRNARAEKSQNLKQQTKPTQTKHQMQSPKKRSSKSKTAKGR